MIRRWLTALAAALVVTSSFAADAAIEGVRLGRPIAGKIDADELKGRVVFVEKWGIH